MTIFSYQFPSTAVAHGALYVNTEEGPAYRYRNTVDFNGRGIPTERYALEDGTELLRQPSDGKYNVDIAADEPPVALEAYRITVSNQWRKHRFVGE